MAQQPVNLEETGTATDAPLSGAAMTDNKLEDDVPFATRLQEVWTFVFIPNLLANATLRTTRESPIHTGKPRGR